MNEKYLKKIDAIAIYTIIYCSVFIALSLAMPYILPFVLGTIIALISQPIINFITKKIKVKRNIIGLIVVLVIFAAIFGILTLIILRIVNELITLSAMLPNTIGRITNDGYGLIDKASSYFASMDPEIVSSIKSNASKLFSGSLTAAVIIVNYLLKILKSLPGMLMLILFTLLTAVYVAIDLPMLKKRIFSILTDDDSSRIKNIIFEANKMMGNYLKAYLILISITFIETYIGTSILKIKYAALISLITSISDLLPVFGPGTILIPLGIILLLSKAYVQGIGILVLYIVVTIVRQILEPKVVSSSLGIYPLSIIIAIFIGLKAYGFTGMIFTVFYVVFYTVLKRVEVL
jgi:sporulation integral membrane protein YtvI